MPGPRHDARPQARRRTTRALAVVTAVVAIALAAVLPFRAPAAVASEGAVSTGTAPSDALGGIAYAAYLPPGYDTTDERYPTLYLLHGRGDTMAAWQHVSSTLDALISEGRIPPMVVIMPDAPWNERGSWYTDSQYTGDAAGGPGLAVESGLVDDLVAHVDATYRTVPDRVARAVGGYSMGGAGALRLTLAHQDMFAAGIVLSPAVYVPLPPADSSTRDYGGYGVGDRLFDEGRFAELSYPAALSSVDPSLPVHLFIAVGDDEWPNPDPADAIHDLTMEATTLYTAARRVPGVTAELRVLDGGHDWDVWDPAFAEGVVDVASRLRSAPLPDWEGTLVGSEGDDRAGGVVAMPDGGSVLAFAAAGPVEGVPHAGGLDVVVQRRDAAGAVSWSTALATEADERAYGVVPGADGGVLVGGYARGDLDGRHPGATRDDGFVASIAADGTTSWVVQIGDPEAADRFYAITADGNGGAYLGGYTGGSLEAPNAGDKDALLVHVDAKGQVERTLQLGGPGEDKGQAVALGADGAVYLGGVAGDALPGGEAHGGLDAFVSRIDPDGTVSWTRQYGSAETDQVWGLVPRADGSVVAIGHTRGTVGASASGDHDVLVRALGADGATLWTTQIGTETDDRGVTGVLGADGRVLVVAMTYGTLADRIGGVDVATIEVDADGTPGPVTQFGSIDRDGADEWDDPNLFVAAGAEAAWISGLTYGAPTGTASAGAGDVFTSVRPFDTEDPVAPTPTPTPVPTSTPAPTPTPTPGPGGPGPDGDAEGNPGGNPGSALPGTGGSPEWRLLAAGVLAALAGVVVVRRARRHTIPGR